MWGPENWSQSVANAWMFFGQLYNHTHLPQEESINVLTSLCTFQSPRKCIPVNVNVEKSGNNNRKCF